jgi:organic radical activating enzyme
MAITNNPDVPLDNKQLRMYDEAGKFIRMSVDETIARGLNKWKGWKCSAGSRGLYIDYDANIWVANCASAHRNSDVHYDTVVEGWRLERERLFGPYPHIDWYNNNTDGGWPLPKEGWETCEQHIKLQEELKIKETEFFLSLGKNLSNQMHDTTASAWKWESTLKDKDNNWGLLGNIREGVDLPTYYVTCPYDQCGCGADVILSKARSNKEAHTLLDVTHNGHEGTLRVENYTTDSIDSGIAMEMNFSIPYQVLWDLGRRCNYNCSYCWPSVHSNTEKFPSYEEVIQGIDMLIDHWSHGSPIRWNFGGGEPTMHPRFMDILKYLKSRNQWVLVTTNGSRSTKFWREASQYINSVNMSAHFASMDLYSGNEDRFVEVCKVIMEHHDAVDDDHWIEIKLMTPPGFLERAQSTRQRILDLGMLDKPGANLRPKGTISLVPIRDLNDAEKLVDYSENEIKYFTNQ